jgi:hypothetical protein
MVLTKRWIYLNPYGQNLPFREAGIAGYVCAELAEKDVNNYRESAP